MGSDYICGVDIGGSHITAALVNVQAKAIVPDTYTRSRVDAGGSTPAIIDTWASVIGPLLLHERNNTGMAGIAMPGPFEYDAGISFMKNQGKYDALYGQDVRQLLSAALGVAGESIFFENDAASFLRGEVSAGAGRGFNRVVGLTLGTGLGSTWHDGQRTLDAALWQMPFEGGIAEDYISARWFIKRYHELTMQTVKDVQALALLTAEVPAAAGIFNEFGMYLGRFLTQVIRQHYPADLIILGGNIANAMPVFIDGVIQVLGENDMHIPVKKAMLGEEAALIGAVMKAWEAGRGQPVAGAS